VRLAASQARLQVLVPECAQEVKVSTNVYMYMLKEPNHAPPARPPGQPGPSWASADGR
jgi:hypothetical protein